MLLHMKETYADCARRQVTEPNLPAETTWAEAVGTGAEAKGFFSPSGGEGRTQNCPQCKASNSPPGAGKMFAFISEGVKFSRGF